MKDRSETLDEILGVLSEASGTPSEELRTMIVPLIDKMQIIKRMSKGTIGQTMQPHYKARQWKPLIQILHQKGILQCWQKNVFMERGYERTLEWYEIAPEYVYEVPGAPEEMVQ